MKKRAATPDEGYFGIDPGGSGAVAFVSADGYWFGIDPGGSGAVAFVSADGYWVADLKTADTTEAQTLARLVFLGSSVFVESVHSMPGQGVASTFKFGVSFGRVLGALEARYVDYTLVRPQEWKKHFGLLKKDKGAALELARKLFPAAPLTRKKDHNRAEALLIAEYGRYLVTGESRVR